MIFRCELERHFLYRRYLAFNDLATLISAFDGKVRQLIALLERAEMGDELLARLVANNYYAEE